MNDTDALFAALRQAAEPHVVNQIEHLVADGSDRDLNRINALAFATSYGLDEDKVIAAFLHVPNTKDRGHNPPNGADLNLRLAGSGGAEGRRIIIRKD